MAPWISSPGPAVSSGPLCSRDCDKPSLPPIQLLAFGDGWIKCRDPSRALRQFRRRAQWPVAVMHAVEYRFETVVIALQDRVKLVVVAMRAVDRQPQESLAHGGEHVFHLFFAH